MSPFPAFPVVSLMPCHATRVPEHSLESKAVTLPQRFHSPWQRLCPNQISQGRFCAEGLLNEHLTPALRRDIATYSDTCVRKTSLTTHLCDPEGRQLLPSSSLLCFSLLLTSGPHAERAMSQPVPEQDRMIWTCPTPHHGLPSRYPAYPAKDTSSA